MTTIVTGYFALNISKKDHDTYLEWMQNMLMINNEMVIFCDSKSYDIIYKFREPFANKTKIIITSFQEFYCYKYLESFKKDYDVDIEKDIGHNVELYMIWCEKSNFLKRAIELNPFQTELFLWVDIGCFRVPNTKYLNWPDSNKMPINKVLLLSVEPFTNDELNSDLENLPQYNSSYIRIGGTIFGGDKKILLLWHKKYYEMLEYFISTNNFISKDQYIMACVYLLNKEMFELIPTKSIDSDDIWFYLQNYLL